VAKANRESGQAEQFERFLRRRRAPNLPDAERATILKLYQLVDGSLVFMEALPFPTGQENGEEFWATEAMHICQNRANAIGGGIQSFAAIALIDADDDQGAQHVLRFSAYADGAQTVPDSASGTALGLLKEAHSQIQVTGRQSAMLIPTVLASHERSIERLESQNKALFEENSKLRDQIHKEWKVVEELRDQQVIRDIKVRRMGLKMDMKEEMGRELLGLFAPAKQIIGDMVKGLLPGAVSADAVKEFFGGLTDEEKLMLGSAIQNCGMPEEKIEKLGQILMALMMTPEQMAEFEKAAAEAKGEGSVH
jgi:hypothetical protein